MVIRFLKGSCLALALVLWTSAKAQERNILSFPRKGTNQFRVEVHLAGGGFKLVNDGQLLFSDGTNHALAILIDGHGGASDHKPIRVVAEEAGPEWEYARLDLSGNYSNQLARFHRHLLFVQPDLFLVYDDIEARKPSAFTIGLNSPMEMQYDKTARDFRVENTNAGLVAYVLLARRSEFQNWMPLGLTTGGSARMFQIISTNQLQEFRAITAMRPHLAGQKKDTGFKLLQSETAIGARIWRSGLPTLIAFRTAPPGTEADLTGFPVPGSVNVDVFNPKPRTPRRPRPQAVENE